MKRTQISAANSKSEVEVLKELRSIPSVGKAVARDLYDLGYRSVGDIHGENPQKMYERLMDLRGQYIDRCMLYTFRCVSYYATEKEHDPERLKWWNWKET